MTNEKMKSIARRILRANRTLNCMGSLMLILEIEAMSTPAKLVLADGLQRIGVTSRDEQIQRLLKPYQN